MVIFNLVKINFLWYSVDRIMTFWCSAKWKSKGTAVVWKYNELSREPTVFDSLICYFQTHTLCSLILLPHTVLHIAGTQNFFFIIR